MSRSFYSLFLFAGIIGLLTGCVSNYDTLEAIPEYPALETKFDQSATVDFKPGEGAMLNKIMLSKFAECGYTDVISGAHYKSVSRKPIRIVSPLDLTQTILRCQDGFYLESRILVMVRQPGKIVNGELTYPTPRYFQAFSQIRIQNATALPDENLRAVGQAVDNLFTIAEFRSALAAGSGN